MYKKFQYSEFVCDWNDGLNKTAVENDMSPAVSRKPIKFDSVFSSEWISFHLMCMCNCCSNDVLHEYKIVLFFFFWIVWLGTYSMCQVAWWLLAESNCGWCAKSTIFFFSNGERHKGRIIFISLHITSHHITSIHVFYIWSAANESFKVFQVRALNILHRI